MLALRQNLAVPSGMTLIPRVRKVSSQVLHMSPRTGAPALNVTKPQENVFFFYQAGAIFAALTHFWTVHVSCSSHFTSSLKLSAR